jgi:hypothetical protein
LNSPKWKALCCGRLVLALTAASSACNCFRVGIFKSGVVNTFPNKAKSVESDEKRKNQLFQSFKHLLYSQIKLNLKWMHDDLVFIVFAWSDQKKISGS